MSQATESTRFGERRPITQNDTSAAPATNHAPTASASTAASETETDRPRTTSGRLLRSPVAQARQWVKHRTEDFSAHLGGRYLRRLRKHPGRVTQSLSGIPLRMHRVANQTQLVLELIDDFVDGTYRQIPWRSMAVLTGAVLYSINPADVVPDALPFVGALDDMAVIAVAVRLVQGDLRAYCRFKGYSEADYFGPARTEPQSSVH